MGGLVIPGTDQAAETRRRTIGFDPLFSSFPGELYVQLEDRIRLQVFNSLAGIQVDLSIRVMRADGTIIPTRTSFLPTSNRAVNNFEIDLCEGVLLSVNVSTPTAGVKCGHCFVTAQLIRNTGSNAIVDHTLLATYLQTGSSAAFPYTYNQTSVQGNGLLRSVTGTQPAAGAEVTEVVPTGARWILFSLVVSLTTSAQVATRTPIFRLDDGANTWFLNVDVANLPAGTTGTLVVSSAAQNQSNGAGVTLIPMLPLMPMAAGHRIRTQTTGLQSGDQYAAPQYLVMEWLEP